LRKADVATEDLDKSVKVVEMALGIAVRTNMEFLGLTIIERSSIKVEVRIMGIIVLKSILICRWFKK